PDPELEDKLAVCDSIDSKKIIGETIEVENDGDLSNDAVDLSNHYEERTVCGSIVNERLEKIKRIKPLHITTISQWVDFAKEQHIPYLYLHKDFKINWICWGDFLLNKTYTYEESKAVMRKYFQNQIETPNDWTQFYFQTIDREITQTRDINMS